MGRRYLKEAGAVADLARKRGIDVLHTHVYRADYIGYFAARQAGIAVASTFHGETGGGLMNRLYEWSVKRLFKRFDAVMCVSEVNRDKLRAAGSDLSNVHLVRNGAVSDDGLDRAAARRELGVNGPEPIVGWIGRLSHEKGPDLLLDAVEMVDGLKLHIVFVGSGPMRDELEARARAAGLRVSFVGSVQNASRLLKAFNVVAMSGRMEGMPMVMLESMAARVPLAGFLVGGIPDVLSQETGWPAPAGDVGALARAIASAVREDRTSCERATTAEALVRRSYSLDSWVEAVERVYSTAVAAR